MFKRGVKLKDHSCHDIIKVLDYANNHKEGFTIDDILKARIVDKFFIDELTHSLCDKCADMFDDEYKESRNKMFNELFAVKNPDIYTDEMTANEFIHEMKFVLNTEGYFKLLQYTETTDSRISAQKAQKTATIAIIIGAIVGLSQIIISLIQPPL